MLKNHWRERKILEIFEMSRFRNTPFPRSPFIANFGNPSLVQKIKISFIKEEISLCIMRILLSKN